MKKLLLFITAIFICGVSIAQTIRWHIGDTVYQTTTCNAGESITPPTVPEKFGYSFVKWKLPYTRIEYLESTGTQYIDTGVVPNQDTGIKTIFNITQNAINYEFIYGSRQDSKVNDFGLNRNAINGNFRFHYNTSFIETDISFKKGVDYTVEQNKNLAIINNHSFSVAYGSFNTPETLVIFAIKSNNGYISDYSRIKLHYFQIYDNDVLVRDFIPVLDGNGTPCMYDKVEKKFYYNAGTGDFIAGPVLTE